MHRQISKSNANKNNLLFHKFIVNSTFLVHDLGVSIENLGRSFFAYAIFLSFTRGKEEAEFSHQLSVQKFRQVQATVLYFFFFPLSSFLYALIQYIPRTHTRTHQKSVVCILLQCDCRYIIIRGIAIDLPVYLENNLLRIRHDSNKYHT